MLLCAATAGWAQPEAAAPPAPTRDALSRYLHDLADNPRSVAALTGAGKAALDMGDAQAALAFFARAEDAAPRDGRVKAMMGAALVQLEQPRAALKFFTDAVQLGCPEAELAGDRGLAWDIMGDPRRAQRDYRLALSHGADPEIGRRLALSLAIGGDREGALRQLADPALAGDRATERTRALVLALNGDTAGAGRVVQAAMPGPSGQAMMPFLARLPQLGYADRALAVHLGHFPGDGRTSAPPPTTYASTTYAASTSAPTTYAPTAYAASSF
ncbi:MAG: tetratricopeptide repeat protein, partial [Allosphingosinicella sp.]